MKEITFKQLNETIYYEKLPNGLDVYILPKQGFNKTYATFTTKYGSIDNHFVPLKKKEPIKVPDGIAHFLEHKLFEKEDGDVFQNFSKQGASANAFTSFTRTAYLFSSTSHVRENLETLLNFVQEPYFTDETVEKEKGIIGQEIRMYDDNADTRLFYGTISNMYHNHPVKIDIAGTVESISETTKEHLYECYETFYHPSNMLLFVVGPVDHNEYFSFIKENQAKKTFAEKSEITRLFEDEPETVAKKSSEIEMPIQTPKCIVGFKEKNPTRSGDELLKHELCLNVALDMLFGQSSAHYTNLYKQGLIDDTFSFDYTEEYGFGFALIGGDTANPEKLTSEIKKMIAEQQKEGFNSQTLERIRKKKIGAFLRALNSPEYIANQFTRYMFNKMNLFDIVKVLEEMSIEDVNEVLRDFFAEERSTVFTIKPK
jgi:predicted Zn-dependent peptidase